VVDDLATIDRLESRFSAMDEEEPEELLQSESWS